MDDTSVPDAASARRLIEEIWKENTVNGTITKHNSPVGRLLENALTALSRELYEKQTHFLLELIQNAEDNTYGDVTPSLSFTYKRGSLRIDCNETGFTERNVRAICKIGESTKAGRGQSARYVGEKGIGFKSVFKVASEVYISSRSFSFKFDQVQAVGLIAPIWSEFPESIRPGYTSFYLKLSENADEEQMSHDIQRLDPTMLLFLRRLREINLKATLMDGSTWSQTLRRQDPSTQNSHITQLHRGPTVSDYIVVKHPVSNLPEEKGRAGVTESEISLAFPPLHETSEGHTHAVSAFLPIRDYGFKFLLQGDFILTANREDVLDNPWNRALRDACADAFVRAIHHLNSGPRRYDWISYIPGRHILGFFEPLTDMILDKLSREPILEACSKKMVAPATLTYVPRSRFTDDDGLPLTLSPSTKDLYLSCSYPELDDTLLSRLGAQTLDSETFLHHLSSMISTTPQHVREKPREWHEKLANVLITLYNEERHRDCIKGLEIIPLSNSEWVSADTGPIYFSEETQQLKIPETVPMRTVSGSIKESPSQINLFRHLGVKPRPDSADVCLRIMKLHGDVSFKPDSLTHVQLAEHITFMFRASFYPPQGNDLWFATTDNQRVKGSSLYIRGQCKPGSLKDRIRKHIEKSYPVLHSAYARHFPSNELAKEEWTQWAQHYFHIQPSTFPRISMGAPLGSRAGNLRLSNEFKSLFKSCHLSDVLELLKVRWLDYSKAFEKVYTIDGKGEGNPVKDSIMAMKVRCRRGKSEAYCFRRFGETILPSLDRIVDEKSCIPLLDVPGPPKQWEFLKAFQVSVYRDIDYYVRCLLAMESSTEEPSRETVVHIYERIQADYMENEEEIRSRKAFMQKPLIYTSLCSSGSDFEMCWMSGKEFLERNLDIAMEYESSASLFRHVLGTGRNAIERQLHTLRAITKGTSLGVILTFFVKIDRLIQTQGSRWFKAAAQGLKKSLEVFPILTNKSDKEYDALASLNPRFPPWFIADREHLRDSFSGCVNILAISPRDIQSIQAFLEALDLQPRILSTIVKVESHALGKPRLHKAYTKSLRRKAPFITALIPKQLEGRDALVGEALGVEVNIAAGIVQKYTFEYGGRQFSGADGPGEVALSERDGRLQVFMTRENISATVPPPELGNDICDRYGIVNPAYRNLVHFALGENSAQRLSSAFTREGIHVPYSDNELAVLWRDELSDDILTDEEDETQDAPEDKFESKFKHIPVGFLGDTDGDDRRLPLKYFKWSERILFRSTSYDPGTGYETVLRQEPAHIQYAAEVLLYLTKRGNNKTSEFLQQELGSLYRPDDHWTSPQRYKAGYSIFSPPVASCATFTITGPEASRKFSAALAQRGFWEASTWIWTNSHPTYHLDMAVSPGGPTSEFDWTSQQFERMRTFQTEKQKRARFSVKDVHVLIRISNIFTSPTIHLFVDPWRLFCLEEFTLQGNWTFAATILDSRTRAIFDPAGDPGAGHWPSLELASMPFPQVAAAHPTHPMYQPPNHQLLGIPGHHIHRESLGGSISVYRPWSTSHQQSSNSTHNPSTAPVPIGFSNNDTGSATEFSYKPLNKDDIRLLVLHPGQVDCDLRAVVYRCPLLAANNFQAVSYTWGSSELSHSLWTPEGTIKLSASLHATLRCIRHEKQPVLLWADGICINQRDDNEKAEQIRLLPQVFQRATCVLACLGSDSKGDGAMEALMQIRVHDALPEDWPKDLAHMPQAWRKRGIPPPNDPIWADIGALFERPWFERAWIIQELLVATSVRVICGKWMIDWSDLLAVMRVIARASQPSPEKALGKAQGKFGRFSKLAKCRDAEAKHERRPLLDLLEDFRDSKSSRDHDRFFCLLGLAKDGNNKNFVVDYRLSFDVIVRKYAWAFIEQGKVLELLHRAGLNPRKKDSLPSWIPDWTVPKPSSLRTLEAQGMPCAASKRLSPRLDTNLMSDLELRLYGFRADEIESISESSNVAEQLGLYMDEVARMVASSSYHHKGDLKWKAPIAGAWRRRSDGLSMESSYLALRKCLGIDRDNPEEGNPWTKVERKARTKAKSTSGKDPNHIGASRDSLWARGQDYYLALQGNLTGWKFVVTKQHRVGIVPPTAKKGDVVFVIHGGVVPFLLRKEGAFRGSFSLVGECYIHGLMNNEAETLCAASEQVISLR
ncbi:HET domain-containing protein [Fusarium sp. LHS14.1]|nr:HET domain-containing protein [Fusarium sp. LHS14.1]